MTTLPSAGEAQRGATLVETALALAVFSLFIVGMIDFSRALMAHSTLTHAAAKGARFAAVRSNSSEVPASAADVRNRVVEAAVGLDPEQLTVTTSWMPANAPGGVVRVAVAYDFEPVSPLVPTGEITLSGRSRVTITN